MVSGYNNNCHLQYCCQANVCGLATGLAHIFDGKLYSRVWQPQYGKYLTNPDDKCRTPFRNISFGLFRYSPKTFNFIECCMAQYMIYKRTLSSNLWISIYLWIKKIIYHFNMERNSSTRSGTGLNNSERNVSSHTQKRWHDWRSSADSFSLTLWRQLICRNCRKSTAWTIKKEQLLQNNTWNPKQDRHTHTPTTYTVLWEKTLMRATKL